ncbi:MAG: ferritin-like domain-containing protein [Hamadaea sp.]|nr:ferritin-like domain-containing protein [Hamadaea sp.]
MTTPTPAPSGGALSADGRARLATALDLEHQAVYGYGALGPHLTGSQRTAARTAEATHRTRRDRLEVLLGDDAPTTSAGYALPQPVTDRTSAAKLAALLEDAVAGAYRAALAATEGAPRKLALDALVDAATRAAAWRRIAGTSPSTVPFPGRPS